MDELKAAEDIDAYRLDTRLRWALKRNLTLRFSAGWVLTTNEQGFAGPVYPVAKPNDVRRVLVLGDSSSFGWGVPASAAYPVQLERRLNAQLGVSRCQVINLSVPGYSSAQGLLLLQTRGITYHPDVVLVGFGTNDAAPVWSGMTDRTKLRWGAGVSNLLSDSYLCLLLKGMYALHLHQGPLLRSAARSTRVPLNDYEQNLEEIITRSTAVGAVVVLLDLCTPLEYRAVLQRVATRDRLPIVSQPDSRERLPDGCHPNIQGHKELAEVLEAVIRPSTNEVTHGAPAND